MSTDDTLEFDAIIEEWSDPQSVIQEHNVSTDNYTMGGFQTRTGVFNPQEAGTYKFKINGQVISIEVTSTTTIPDSNVSRSSDGRDGLISQAEGLKFTTSQRWTKFQAKISSRSPTTSGEMAIIERVSDGVQMASLDISSKTSNDIITFNNIDLSANTSYYIYADPSSERTRGFSSASYPYTSSDGNLTIDSGYQSGEVDNWAFYFVTIGNIDL